MSNKAKIKEEVLHRHLADCIFAADKAEQDGITNGIPRLRSSALNNDTLESIVSAIDDTGVRMHGLTYTPGMLGETLLNTILAPVRRFFSEFPHGETYVMRFDIGIFMPEPKRATQIDHTKGIIADMERKNIAPIAWSVGEPVPQMIAFGIPMPNWTAVRADRTLFRHACNQMMDLIQAIYKPPRGCRLILDYNVPCTSSGIGSLDQWMACPRVRCSPLATRIIAAARRRFASMEHWHAEADRLVVELAHRGHVRVLPVCIETSLDDGTTYRPFLLPNAAHNCGEADVGCLFWADALQNERLHETLVGERRTGLSEITPEMREMYSDEQLARFEAQLIAPPAPQPLSVVARHAEALQIIERDPNALIAANDAALPISRQLTFGLQFNSARAPRMACGAALIISVDTDFFALTLLWYAQFYAAHSADCIEYRRTHAPFLSLGDIKTRKSGWLTADDIVTTAALKKTPDPTVLHRFEIWDIGRLYERVLTLTNSGSPMERIASFALFCAACKNDYLPGFPEVNRCFTYDAFVSTGGALVRYVDGKPIVDQPNVIRLIKHAYYNSIVKKGGPHAPKRPATELTYAQVASAVAAKYKAVESHMPSKDALILLYRRYQWWISMATEAWRDLGAIVDHRHWGWPGRL